MTPVGKLAIEAAGECGIRATRVFNAPRRLLWDAHTKPELVRRWMLGPPGWDMPVCEIDPRVGGRFRYRWRDSAGNEFGQSGSFRELSPYDRIVHVEKFDGDEMPGDGAIITTIFEEHAKRTTMTMMMLFPSPEIRDQALGSGMADGMEVGYERLDAMLTEPAG